MQHTRAVPPCRPFPLQPLCFLGDPAATLPSWRPKMQRDATLNPNFDPCSGPPSSSAGSRMPALRARQNDETNPPPPLTLAPKTPYFSARRGRALRRDKAPYSRSNPSLSRQTTKRSQTGCAPSHHVRTIRPPSHPHIESLQCDIPSPAHSACNVMQHRNRKSSGPYRPRTAPRTAASHATSCNIPAVPPRRPSPFQLLCFLGDLGGSFASLRATNATRCNTKFEFGPRIGPPSPPWYADPDRAKRRNEPKPTFYPRESVSIRGQLSLELAATLC
jgi:hypothetical protein